MRKHYHVLQGLRGMYMADSNSICRTRKDAIAVARDEAKRARDDGEKVHGNGTGGYYFVGEHNCIEITTCTLRSCLCKTCNDVLDSDSPWEECDNCRREERSAVQG